MADIQPNKKTSAEADAGTLLDTDLVRIVQGLGSEPSPWVSVKTTLAALKAYFGAGGGGGGGTGVVETVVAGTGITVDSTDPANPVVSLTPAAAAAYRWFRVFIASTPGGNYCAIGEIELRATLGGADLTTTSTPVYAASSFSSTPPPRAVDNILNDASRVWINDNTGYPTWFALDMGTPQTVVQVAMAPQPTESGTPRLDRSPNNFVIQGSNDPTSIVSLVTNWKTLAAFEGVTGYADNTLKTFNL